jgi:superfamily II DNA/RNA helicase
MHPDDYVHRIGRTGRAGRSGTAITIVAGSNDAKAVAAIEKLIGQTIPFMDAPAGAPAAPRPPARQHHHGRGEQQRRPQRPHQPAQPPARPPAQPPAQVARIEDARPRRAPQPLPKRTEDGDASHLPAFLLRPLPAKA